MATLKELIRKALQMTTPTGTMLPFAGKSVPEGWLLCNGAAVSRTTYAKLFAAIGTTWGSGDGSTTFNLPNCEGRFLEGTEDVSNVGKYLSAGLPNITGAVRNIIYGSHSGTPAATGALFSDGYGNGKYLYSGDGSYWTGICNVGIYASNANAIYSGESVQPCACYTLMIIKA